MVSLYIDDEEMKIPGPVEVASHSFISQTQVTGRSLLDVYLRLCCASIGSFFS